MVDFPPGTRIQRRADYVALASGPRSVSYVERATSSSGLFDPCLLYDCRPTGILREDIPVQLKDGGGPEARLRYDTRGYRAGMVTPYPAWGQYRVHVVGLYHDALPLQPFGALLASAPKGALAWVDAMRGALDSEARRWTNGALGLELEYVDHGFLRLPPAAELGTGPFTTGGGVMDLNPVQHLARALVRGALGPRDVLLIIEVRPADQLAVVNGVAVREFGLAHVRIPPTSRADDFWPIPLHELGHIFGATDLYDGTGNCAFALSDEVTVPNMYCQTWSQTIARITARSFGWIQADGGPATAPPPQCVPAPGSRLGCDP